MKISRSLKRFALAGFFVIAVFACKKSLTEDLINTTQSQPVTPVIKDPVSVQTTPEIHFPVVMNVNCNGPDYGDSIIYLQAIGLLQNSSTGAINVTQIAPQVKLIFHIKKSDTPQSLLNKIAYRQNDICWIS